MATLAVFAALGGSAGAASKVITGRQIKDGTIQYQDLSKKARAKLLAEACGSPTIAACRGAKGDTGPQGAKGDTGSQGDPGAPATSLWAVINPGLCSPDCNLPRSSGVTQVTRNDTGVFTATLNQSVANCAYLATIGQIEGGSLSDGGQVSVLKNTSNPDKVNVYTYDKSGTATDRWFHLGVFC